MQKHSKIIIISKFHALKYLLVFAVCSKRMKFYAQI